MPHERILITTIVGIDGVVKASSGDYHISVEKGRAFSWDELEPEILELLNAHTPGPMGETRELRGIRVQGGVT